MMKDKDPNLEEIEASHEERGGGESADSEALSLLSYTLRYVRLADFIQTVINSVY